MVFRHKPTPTPYFKHQLQFSAIGDVPDPDLSKTP